MRGDRREGRRATAHVGKRGIAQRRERERFAAEDVGEVRAARSAHIGEICRWTKQELVGDAEHGGVRADPKRENDHDTQREAWLFAKRPHDVAEVAAQTAPRLAALVFPQASLVHRRELAMRRGHFPVLPLCLLLRRSIGEAGGAQVGGAAVNVEANLVGDITGDGARR